MKTNLGLYCLLGVLVPGQGEAFDPNDVGTPPDWHFETETHTDGSRSLRLAFQTVAGVDYHLESSTDCVTWTAEEEDRWYGLGHEIVVPMVQTEAPVVPPDPPLGDPPPPTIPASILMRPVTGNGLALSWRSLDDGGPRVHHFPLLTPDPAWNSVPLMAASNGEHLFLILYPGTAVDPPSGNQQQGSADLAMLADFEAGFVAMNQAVQDGEASARNRPPPSPPAEGSRKFWRIRADWGLDSDGDGSLDIDEMVVLGDAGHPQQALADAFSADADGDGVADGEQLDGDRDGITDALDADPRNNMIRWKKTPHQLYALFEVPFDPATELGMDGPFQVDDLGRVLFRNRVWDRAITHATGDDQDFLAMNDEGVIVGEMVHGGSLVMGFWSGPGADPSPIIGGEYHASATEDMVAGIVQPKPVFANGGWLATVFVRRVPGGPGEDDEWIHPDPVKRAVWILPSDGGAVPVPAEVEDYIQFADQSGIAWGFNPGAGSATVSVAPGIPGEQGIGPKHYSGFVELPEGNPMFFGGTDVPARGMSNGAWVDIPALEDIHAMSEGGTGRMNLGSIWRNGVASPFREECPGLPEPWDVHGVNEPEKEKLEVMDISRAGTILVGLGGHRASGDLYKVGSALPVWVEDDEFATGVDNVSATCHAGEPGSSQYDWSTGPHWIMAPAGTEGDPGNLTRLHVPSEVNQPTPPGEDEQEVPVTLAVEGATSEPNELGGLFTDVCWTGDLTESADAGVVFSLGPNPAISTPIGVKVMKKRTVSIHVWHIALARPNEDPVPPEVTVTQADVETYLDRVFGKQINVFWDATVDGLVQPALVNWDVATSEDFGSTEVGRIQSPNGQFDVREDEPSVEQMAIASSGRTDTNANINVYVVGGCDGFACWNLEGPFLKPSLLEPVGLAHPGLRKIWLLGKSRGSSEIESKDEILGTLAHEVGHIMIGEGHPDSGAFPSVAPLPGTRWSDRLMYSSGGGVARRILLVKGEWDACENWLKEEEENNRL